MNDGNNTITSRQLGHLIAASMTGVSLISLPSTLAKHVGHDGWITIAVSGILAIIFEVVIVKLLTLYKNKSIFEINLFLYRKFIGTVINTVYLCYLVFKISINLRVVIEVIQSVVLKATSPLILTPLIYVCVFYMCRYGLKPICRFNNLIYLSYLLVLVIFISSLKEVRPTFLLPVGECGIPSVLNSMMSTAYSFLALAFTWVVYPMVKDKDKVLGSAVKALAFSTLFFILVVVITTGYLGENMLKHLSFPLHYMATSYRAPVIERIDLFFMVVWFTAMEITLNAYTFIPYYWIVRLLNIKKRTLPLIIFSIVIIILSRIPKDMAQTNQLMLVADSIGVPLILCMAVFGYLMSLVSRRRVDKR